MSPKSNQIPTFINPIIIIGYVKCCQQTFYWKSNRPPQINDCWALHVLKLMSDGRVEHDSLKVPATGCSAGFDKLGVRRCRPLNLNPDCVQWVVYFYVLGGTLLTLPTITMWVEHKQLSNVEFASSFANKSLPDYMYAHLKNSNLFNKQPKPPS